MTSRKMVNTESDSSTMVFQ